MLESDTGTVVCVLTILSAALQSVSFKKAGYSLMSFPYIILLVVAFSFIPILFLFVFYIDKTYGILKESKTVEVKKTFAVLGFLNAANGVLIIFQQPTCFRYRSKCPSTGSHSDHTGSFSIDFKSFV